VYSMDYGKLLTLKASDAGKEEFDKIVNYFEIESILNRIGKFGGIPSLSEVLEGLEAVKDLKNIFGTLRVVQDGIDVSNIKDETYLINNCVLDDLL
jgi:hypothetical protein